MKEAMALTLITAILGMVHPVLAEDTLQATPPAAAAPTLDDRIANCTSNPDCPLTDRMQLMDEMSAAMRASVMNMHQTCRDMKYTDCIGPRNERAQQWRKMDRHMREMMGAIAPDTAQPSEKVSDLPLGSTESDKAAAGVSIEKMEPAAGDSESGKPLPEKRSWWREYFSR